MEFYGLLEKKICPMFRTTVKGHILLVIVQFLVDTEWHYYLFPWRCIELSDKDL